MVMPPAVIPDRGDRGIIGQVPVDYRARRYDTSEDEFKEYGEPTPDLPSALSYD